MLVTVLENNQILPFEVVVEVVVEAVVEAVVEVVVEVPDELPFELPDELPFELPDELRGQVCSVPVLEFIQVMTAVTLNTNYIS